MGHKINVLLATYLQIVHTACHFGYSFLLYYSLDLHKFNVIDDDDDAVYAYLGSRHACMLVSG